MATPDLELKQAFAELQLKLIDTNQTIKFTDIQIESLKRSMLHKEITNREMGNLPVTTPVYEAVGRAFFASNIPKVKETLGKSVKEFAEKIRGFENGKDILEKDYKSTENAVRELVLRKKN
ncbi:prefoldin subunit 1 [Folsomia candida]|uniref:Prefoldin subunit 1 n=1 Tax=Folsomia candida TaxID=158441 RepID=A0A226EPC9_FOLCA|nr:prefoldin subunit 1 [Folsomia candida]OXA58997.1 Prefoldin subunit 1 [Folsomia candida]